MDIKEVIKHLEKHGEMSPFKALDKTKNALWAFAFVLGALPALLLNFFNVAGPLCLVVLVVAGIRVAINRTRRL